MNQTNWLGHKIHLNVIEANEEQLEAILKLKPTANTNELNSGPYLILQIGYQCSMD